jgi:hypothetical protein
VQLLVEPFQHANIEHVLARAYSLGDLTDFAEVSQTGNTGNASGDMLPSFNAVNFTLRAASRAVRPGSKRIVGLAEGMVAGDFITNATTIGEMNAYRLALAATIESPNDNTEYFPVIVKRVPYTTSKGTEAYRWPTTDAELVAPAVTGALLNLRVSHQVSRGNSR